jgi:tetrahydromethanopterin S-methyltransferase subunit B
MRENEEYLAGWQAGTVAGFVIGILALGVLALLKLGF